MKENIQKIIKELQSEIEDLKESSKPVKPENSLGRLTCMDAMAAQMMNVAAMERLKLRIEKLTAAIVRVENGEYGICLSCGEEIGEKRLLTIAQATICIECS
jgi:DnaK suppressor protein